MKISRYTFILDSNGRYYLYNSLSNALVEVDHETYSFLKEHEAGGMPVDESSIDKTLWQMPALLKHRKRNIPYRMY